MTLRRRVLPGTPALAGVLALGMAALTAAACAAQAPAVVQTPADYAGAPPGCAASAADRRVSAAAALASALALARPGETIVLAAGIYRGDFTVIASGRPAAPITLCGPRNAVLEGPSVQRGYVLHLDGASWWRVLGFTVDGGQKGIVTDRASHDLLSGLYVHSTGDEAIHLRSFSSDDTITHTVIRDTGLLDQFYGEGIYVGSAYQDWCAYTGCGPDASDDDQIIGNDISGTTAENIDVKEGTTGGLIAGNDFAGAGMVVSAATAWVNVKGNDWTIEDNTGTGSIGDGFRDVQVYPGWGIGNVFTGNDARVDGPGYGFYVQSSHLGVSVACDNLVSGAARGLSDIPCSSS